MRNTPDFTELVAVLRAADIGICDEAADAIADLEREVAELRERLAETGAELDLIKRFPSMWYMRQMQERKRDNDQTGAET